MCLIKAHVVKSSVRKLDMLTRINIVRNHKGTIRNKKLEWSLPLPFNKALVCEILHIIKIQLSILGKKKKPGTDRIRHLTTGSCADKNS